MLDVAALVAEFLGTFLLGLAVFASGNNPMVVGAILAGIILLIGKNSGAHVNPAISAAMYMKGALSLNEFAAYATSQIAGALACLYTYRVFA